MWHRICSGDATGRLEQTRENRQNTGSTGVNQESKRDKSVNIVKMRLDAIRENTENEGGKKTSHPNRCTTSPMASSVRVTMAYAEVEVCKGRATSSFYSVAVTSPRRK
jgi:hypothetical protein